MTAGRSGAASGTAALHFSSSSSSAPHRPWHPTPFAHVEIRSADCQGPRSRAGTSQCFTETLSSLAPNGPPACITPAPATAPTKLHCGSCRSNRSPRKLSRRHGVKEWPSSRPPSPGLLLQVCIRACLLAYQRLAVQLAGAGLPCGEGLKPVAELRWQSRPFWKR